MAAIDNSVSYELSNQYLVPDFPSKYYKEIMADFKDTEAFLFTCAGEIFGSGKYKGKIIVEVGCGPTVHHVAIPSKYYDVIITSDYNSENVESVKKWVAGDPDSLDWTQFLEIIAKVEGHSDIKEIEARLRQKIKSVLRCDVLKPSIFEQEIDKADLLVTSSCLEGACPSLESFASAVKNLGHHVKTGGYIFIISTVGMSSVQFDGREIKALKVDKDFVTKAVTDACFEIEHTFFRANDIPGIEFDGTSVIMAKKL